MNKYGKIYVKSMTGHGHIELLCDNNIKVLIDIFSTNHRQLDISFDLPNEIMPLQNDLIKIIKEKIKRGSILCKIAVMYQKEKLTQLISDSTEFLKIKRSIENIRKIGRKLKLKDDITLSSVLVNLEKLNGALTQKRPNIIDYNKLLSAFEKATEKMIEMRKKEGKTLANDILNRLKSIESNVNKIERIAPQVVTQYRQKLLSNLKKLIQQIEIDKERILKEVAFMSEKTDITEEITRLKSHIVQFRNTIFSNEPYGKKLDFLLQEMIRECSTMSAKANNCKISHLIVNCRADIERIREQVQNLE